MKALVLLYQGEVVDAGTSADVLDILALPDISYFRRDLPYSVRFAGQSGSGWTFRCDQGIVLLPERPFVLCVMVDGLPKERGPGRRDYSKADGIIAEATRLALAYFEGPTKSSHRK